MVNILTTSLYLYVYSQQENSPTAVDQKKTYGGAKKCADRGSKNANVGQLNRGQIGLFSEPLSAQILTDYEPLLVIIRVDKSVFF